MTEGQDNIPAVPSPGFGEGGWMGKLAEIPAAVFQPFSLSAVAIVAAIILGVYGSLWGSIAALATAIVLLGVGLKGTPREAVGALVSSDTYQQVSPISVATPVERAGLTKGRGGELSPLEAIFFLHLYQREGGSVGVYGRLIPMDYFVDLLSASLVPSHLEVLRREFVEHIQRTGRLDDATTAATPKRGNVLLASAAAGELELELVFIKQRPLFGKLIEGIGGLPKVAVLLDDVASDGGLLSDSVQTLRDSGYKVTDAIVLINRAEGDTRDELAQMGVRLWALYTLSDKELEAIAGRARRQNQ